MLRHAVRTAVVVALAQAVASVDPFAKSYWIPLTVIVILQPSFGSTVDRSGQRVVGTVGGVLVAFAVTSQLDDLVWALAAVFGLLIFALGSLRELNYSLSVISLTPAVIVLASIGGGGSDLAWDRLGGTLVGAALALAGARLLWPTWERETLRATLGTGAARECEYLAEVMVGGDHNEVRGMHRAAERARSNAEVSVQRMLREPRRRWLAPSVVRRYCRLLRSLIESTTSLRAALLDSETDDGRPPGERVVTAAPAAAQLELRAARDQLDAVSVLLAGPSSSAPPVAAPTLAAPTLAAPDLGAAVVAQLSARISGDAADLRRTAEQLERLVASS